MVFPSLYCSNKISIRLLKAATVICLEAVAVFPLPPVAVQLTVLVPATKLLVFVGVHEILPPLIP